MEARTGTVTAQERLDGLLVSFKVLFYDVKSLCFVHHLRTLAYIRRRRRVYRRRLVKMRLYFTLSFISYLDLFNGVFDIII